MNDLRQQQRKLNLPLQQSTAYNAIFLTNYESSENDLEG